MVLEERFDVERRAGTGSMATVFRARDRETGRPVAVKIAAPAVDSESSERFVREVEILAALDHPHIVRYAAHGRTRAGEQFLAMEWLDGEDLAARLARGTLPLADAVELVSRVADALGAAHALGIVHRDVKPSNLFLPGGRIAAVKLLDFGVARLGVPPGMELTRTGTPVGTPAYMAPEQVRGSRRVDARADLFSLGCVLYECVTGNAPFVGAQGLSALAKVLVEDPIPARTLRPDVPPELEALLLQLLAKDAGARPASAGALAAELRSLPATAGPFVPAPAPPRRFCAVLLGDGASPAIEIAAEHGVRLEPLIGVGWMARVEDEAAVGTLARVARAGGFASAMAIAAGQDGHVLDRAVGALACSAPGTVRLDDTAAMLMTEPAARDADGAYLSMPEELAPEAVRGRIEAGRARGDADEVLAWIGRAGALPASEPQIACLARGAAALLDLGEPELARAVAAKVDALVAARGGAGAAVAILRLALLRHAGDVRAAALAEPPAGDPEVRAELAEALVDAGEPDRACHEAANALAAAVAPETTAAARLALIRARLALGDDPGAARALDELGVTDFPRVEGLASILRSRLALRAGKGAEAETLARESAQCLRRFPGPRAAALAAVAEALLGQGRAGDALVPAGEAVRLLALCGGGGAYAREVRRVLAAVLEAAGDGEGAARAKQGV